MNKDMFMTIVHGVREYETYFVMKKAAVALLGFSSIQNCTATMMMIAYGAPADKQDDYLRMD
jgi:hypothetical protein